MLDPYVAREALTPPPARAADVRLSGLPAVGGGLVQGALDDEPWRPGGYVPESGTVQVLTVDGHPRSLESPPATDLGPLATRVSALESTVNTGPNRSSLLRSDLSALTTRVSALESDTDWVNVPLMSGFTGSLAYRVRNQICYWDGSVTRTAGAFPTTWTQIANVPAAAIPSRTGVFGLWGRVPVGPLNCDIYSSGNLRIAGTGTGGSSTAVLSGLSYPV